MIEKQLQKAENAFTRVINVGMCLIPHEDLSDIIADDVIGFGTTKDEIMRSFQDVDDLFHSQYKQMEGLTPKVSRERVSTKISPDGTSVTIVEFLTLDLSSEEIQNTLNIRASGTFFISENECKMVHWHASAPVETVENDHWHIEEWKKEKEKLQKLVDEQTADLQRKNRELEIEAALERVRAVAMGMQRPDDMLQICRIISEQLVLLGVEHIRNIQTIIIHEEKGVFDNYLYFDRLEKEVHEVNDFRINPVFLELVNRMLDSADGFFTGTLEGDAFTQWRNHRIRDGQFSDPSLDEIASMDYHFYSIGPGGLGVTLYKPLNEEGQAIFKRFHLVFAMAYKRFQDIQIAEAQAREAQIEAALERVRSKAMAMQKSEDLTNIVKVLYEQVDLLDLGDWGCGIQIFNEREEYFENWMASSDDDLTPQCFLFKGIGHPELERQWNAWRSKEETYFLILEGERKKSYDEYIFANTDFKFFPDSVKQGIRNMKAGYLSFAYMQYGFVTAISASALLSESNMKILTRFAGVFEQSYTRFLDLKKAEEQAREAQMELTLERIRAHVTAMKESSDLFDIVVSMRREFVSLGHDADYFWHMRWLPDRYEMSMTSETGDRLGMVVTVPKWVHDNIPSLNEWELGKDPIFVLALDAEGAWDYIDKMNTYGSYEVIDPHAPTEEDIHQIGGLTFVIARTSHGEIGFSLPGEVHNPDGESLKTLTRFAGVFDLAYRRFEDLKEAEAQARDTNIALALEKIRSKVTAMHESSDLLDIVVSMRSEFVNLGHEAHYFWYMSWLPDTYHKAMTSGDGKRIGMVMKLPRSIHGNIPLIAQWEKGSDPAVVYPMHVEDAISYVHNMVEMGDFQQIDPNAPTDDDIRTIGGLTFVMARTSRGEIGFSLPGVVEKPNEESLKILIRFAGVFDLAYRRFEDLKEAENQALLIRSERDRLELALTQLQATQTQLIHAEKMASLGELTAGIAHEIQNPLNFVNNFSELSSELVDEMVEELENGDAEEAKTIGADIKNNLEKINHHGKRADAIVKGMLAHSRSGKGQKELTDINQLADEYLRLSYHGLRAKDSSFNADFKTDFDPNLPKINVIPQDIGRVLLNLINNAFQACAEVGQNTSTERSRSATGLSMTEGSQSESTHFERSRSATGLVTITTKLIANPKGTGSQQPIANSGHLELVEGQLLIAITDNGPGIPDNIKDKIFQPFFTTKPTGQGTGLGLSLSYDIIKAHSGNITVESSPELGTTFTVQLPITLAS